VSDIPDWALFEAARIGKWSYIPDVPDKGLGELRRDYNSGPNVYSALCDMIVAHEQPPVDEDREALIRILQAADIGPDDMFPRNFDNAVAQYKKEKADG